MQVMRSVSFGPDKFVGGLIMAFSLLTGFLIAGLNAGGFGPQVLLMMAPISAPGVIAGLGVFLSRRWGFWIVGILALLSLLPIPLSIIGEGGDVRSAAINGVPAIFVLVFCEFRLRAKYGPAPS